MSFEADFDRLWHEHFDVSGQVLTLEQVTEAPTLPELVLPEDLPEGPLWLPITAKPLTVEDVSQEVRKVRRISYSWQSFLTMYAISATLVAAVKW